MNVLMAKTTVTLMRCVPTLRGHTFVAVLEDMKAMVETVKVWVVCLLSLLTSINFLKQFVHGICCIVYAAIVPSCSPTFGANAFCQEGVCACHVGYVGDGYNCTGLNIRHIYLSYQFLISMT